MRNHGLCIFARYLEITLNAFMFQFSVSRPSYSAKPMLEWFFNSAVFFPILIFVTPFAFARIILRLSLFCRYKDNMRRPWRRSIRPWPWGSRPVKTLKDSLRSGTRPCRWVITPSALPTDFLILFECFLRFLCVCSMLWLLEFWDFREKGHIWSVQCCQNKRQTTILFKTKRTFLSWNSPCQSHYSE